MTRAEKIQAAIDALPNATGPGRGNGWGESSRDLPGTSPWSARAWYLDHLRKYVFELSPGTSLRRGGCWARRETDAQGSSAHLGRGGEEHASQEPDPDPDEDRAGCGELRCAVVRDAPGVPSARTAGASGTQRVHAVAWSRLPHRRARCSEAGPNPRTDVGSEVHGSCV